MPPNYIRGLIGDDLNIHETYQGNGRANGFRKRIDDLDSRDQPLCEFVTATVLTRPHYLRSKYGEDSIWRVASVKAAKQWILGKIFSCLSLISF